VICWERAMPEAISVKEAASASLDPVSLMIVPFLEHIGEVSVRCAQMNVKAELRLDVWGIDAKRRWTGA
jgi:hypothetical protein